MQSDHHRMQSITVMSCEKPDFKLCIETEPSVYLDKNLHCIPVDSEMIGSRVYLQRSCSTEVMGTTLSDIVETPTVQSIIKSAAESDISYAALKQQSRVDRSNGAKSLPRDTGLREFCSDDSVADRLSFFDGTKLCVRDASRPAMIDRSHLNHNDVNTCIHTAAAEARLCSAIGADVANNIKKCDTSEKQLTVIGMPGSSTDTSTVLTEHIQQWSKEILKKLWNFLGCPQYLLSTSFKHSRTSCLLLFFTLFK
jgi:hypothetical protein